jgi:hypothetical protein
MTQTFKLRVEQRNGQPLVLPREFASIQEALSARTNRVKLAVVYSDGSLAQRVAR